MRWSQPQYEHDCTEMFPARVVALLLAGHRARIGERSTEHYGSEIAVANRWLMRQSKTLRAAKITRAFDLNQLNEYAEQYAEHCRRLRPLDQWDDAAQLRALAHRLAFCEGIGIEVHFTKKTRFEGIVMRLEEPHWWRRQLRKSWTRASENACRELGTIRKGTDPFASLDAVRFRRAQRLTHRGFMERHIMVSSAGEQLSLLAIAERSLSNPALRRGEFMCRARGFEAIAQDLGHVAEFVTLTTPSAYHAQLAGGGRNTRFEGFNVREAQAWLCKMWARVRAKLQRLSIGCYGFRIAEPHHDGTPHWHLLMFLPAHHADTFRKVIHDHFLAEYGDEPGARDVRVKFERIDPAQGSATGYIAKYVAKNIDGAGQIGTAPDDETDRPVSESVERVDAWASIHGIRQFQQIGGAPVGLWREARRLRDPVADRDIERARLAADRGDWRGFIYAAACNDPNPGRKTALKLEKESTGECNRYRELKLERVTGLRYCSAVVITRTKRWRIQRRRMGGAASTVRVPKARNDQNARPSRLLSGSSLGPVSITVREHDSTTCPYCEAERRGDPWTTSPGSKQNRSMAQAMPRS